MIKVLDHGFVEYKGHLGSEEDIIEAARQSTQKGFLGWEKSCAACGLVNATPDMRSTDPYCSHAVVRDGDSKLLEYLYKNRHMTPFEMCELRVQIKAPIFIFREIHRHRTFSYNEMSARYIQMPNEHYVPEPRMQDKKNKQGSFKSQDWDPQGTMDQWAKEQQGIYERYNNYVNLGIAKEVARINTPVSRYSIMWMKGNLRNWLQFFQLRDHKAAQLEMQEYAKAIASIVQNLWPRTYALYEEYTKNAITLSAQECETLRKYMKDYRLYAPAMQDDDKDEIKAEYMKIEVKFEDNVK